MKAPIDVPIVAVVCKTLPAASITVPAAAPAMLSILWRPRRPAAAPSARRPDKAWPDGCGDHALENPRRRAAARGRRRQTNLTSELTRSHTVSVRLANTPLCGLTLKRRSSAPFLTKTRLGRQRDNTPRPLRCYRSARHLLVSSSCAPTRRCGSSQVQKRGSTTRRPGTARGACK